MIGNNKPACFKKTCNNPVGPTSIAILLQPDEKNRGVKPLQQNKVISR